jgi:hypothetical protein
MGRNRFAVRLKSLMPPSQQQPNLFKRRNLWINFANDLPLMNYQKPIRKTRHFF